MLSQRFYAIKNRLPSKVNLVCVSKTKPASDVVALYALGQRHFGENYVQEGIEKKAMVATLLDSANDICWHYIGHIQRNKTRDIATHFDWVHTIERPIIAQRLDQQRQGRPPLNVLIQVNIDNEPTKSGCQVGELSQLVETVDALPNLTLRGLMIIPSKDGDTQAFEQTKALFDDIKAHHHLPHWDTLSMGMSGDYENAIEQGATMVRVGSAIFGRR